jgi:TetR/AcrR family transcriptional repressor of nem operon
MRYTPEHKEKTRAKILDSAATAFRLHGFHATGVDKVMEEAGLTAGGFYAHFPSKDALLAEALLHCAMDVKSRRDRALENRSGREWVEAFINRYLDAAHRARPENGCPIPSLAPEVARAGEAPRETFEQVIKDMITRIADQLPTEDAGDRAIAILALCVGGMTLARAVREEKYSDRILAACGEFARKNLDARVRARPEKPRRRRPKAR